MSAFDKLSKQELARWRLHTQRLVGQRWNDPVAVVEGMLAFQAENFSQSGWALATRCDPTPTESNFQDLFDAGRILRTHVIRPTWHYVLPDDIVWLTELTARRFHKSYIKAHQEPEGISDRQRDRMVAVAVTAVEAEGPLTRGQIREHLADAGLPTGGSALIVTLAFAEMSAALCSGPRVDGAQTYALLSDRAPDARRLERPEALAELALRYVTSHGPMTEHDLAYWATLTLTDVRTALASIADQVETFDHEGGTYWYRRGQEPPPERPAAEPPTAHILQILDEIYRGYHVASRWALDAAGIVERAREKAIGMALIDGQLVAAMQRRLTADAVEFTLDPYRPLTDVEQGALAGVAAAYGRYCERAAALTID